MIKTNIKMRVTPEQSAKVQEICFENGIDWRHKTKSKTLICINEPFIFVKEDKYLTWLTKLEESDFMKAKEKEIDPDLFIRTNGTCIEEKQEFTYPMWFKSKSSGNIIEFTGLRTGKAICLSPSFIDPSYLLGVITSTWTPHTDTDNWEQVENPFIDKAIETVINEEYHNAHYKAQKIDTIARCKANMTLEQQKAICIFQIDRYTHREKGQNLSDIKKTRDYLDWLEEIENQLKKDNEDYQEWQ